MPFSKLGKERPVGLPRRELAIRHFDLTFSAYKLRKASGAFLPRILSLASRAKVISAKVLKRYPRPCCRRSHWRPAFNLEFVHFDWMHWRNLALHWRHSVLLVSLAFPMVNKTQSDWPTFPLVQWASAVFVFNDHDSSWRSRSRREGVYGSPFACETRPAGREAFHTPSGCFWVNASGRGYLGTFKLGMYFKGRVWTKMYSM